MYIGHAQVPHTPTTETGLTARRSAAGSRAELYGLNQNGNKRDNARTNQQNKIASPWLNSSNNDKR